MASIFRERVPFELVIQDDKLMGTLWKLLSIPQQVILKAAYGLPLVTQAELAAWSILNDAVTYDDLFFPSSIVPVPYEPREYRTVVGNIGRRSGKSFLTCFGAIYEIIFGGHTKKDIQGQPFIVPYVAQDLATAKINMAMIGVLCKEVAKLEAQMERCLPDVIEFKNGIKVVAEPPVIKTGRGVAIPLAILDEVGFWYKDSQNANPDFEVVRAIRPAMAQFPHAKMFVISSPYTEEGILWEASRAGTGGKKTLDPVLKKKYANTLVMQASTAAMANPELVKAGIKDRLAEEQAALGDEGFIREYGARFISAISGYFPQGLVQAAVDSGVSARTRKDIEKNILSPHYIAAMDPAFRHDSWAFTICHRDQYGRVIQDVLKVWTPNKKAGIILNPADILAEISLICQEWGIKVIYSDQYQLESLQQIALSLKISIQGEDFTGRSKSKIFGSFLQLLRQGSIRLLDDSTLYQQLMWVQKKHGAMGTVQISAPPGKHDDVACATALACHMALTAYPKVAIAKRQKTLFDEGIETIKRRRVLAESEGLWV